MPNQDEVNPFARPANSGRPEGQGQPEASGRPEAQGSTALPNRDEAPRSIANPYTPTSQVGPVSHALGDDVEAVRRYYLSHEASVKSIGTLYLLGAILMVPIGLAMIAMPVVAGIAEKVAPAEAILMAVIGLVYLTLGLLQGFTALNLWKLRPWARIVASVLSVIGLLAFPIGTLISAYFLYLLLSEKGQFVFSPGYQQVVAQTPHIKYKTSIIVWILLALLLGLIGLGVVAALVGV
ncbi:hypothetical protein Pla52o_01910 [Novipirellula galeiformis]|uniref:Yip1 domain protein n=1 Tax=Novipirellula galeiformis TaxID=2528004 RepID=A0A5C6CPL6_9BACT|nr:hypothetical protein [Novipirellula galeiformis]TWU26338.1 hypothetical protein Pla52o_01910 [Novipirellula galeiformis]